MSSSSEPRQVFVHDLNIDGCGGLYTITGWIEKRRNQQDRISVELKDATGKIWVQLPKSGVVISTGKRIRVTGVLRVSTRNSNGFALDCTLQPELVADLDTPYGDIDVHMQEQAARVLQSRTIRVLSDALEDQRFTPFDSKVISTSVSDHGLEGMQVIYPGFGSPVALITSPASQIREFLLVTGQLRAFTVGMSFSTTFRLPNAGNEARIVMGLALDMSDDDHEELLHNLAQKVLSAVGYAGDDVVDQCERTLRVLQRDTANVVAPRRRSMNLHRWVQIVAGGDALIAEGAIEPLGEDGRLASLTFYPSQVLGLLARTPTRRLMDLGMTRVWKP